MASRSSSLFWSSSPTVFDLGALEAVAGTLGEVELLDGELEVGRRRHRGVGLGERQALGLVAHLLDELDERLQRGAGRGEHVAGRRRTVGLDVEHEAVVVGRLLDAGRLDRERHATDRGEDGVDRDDTDGGRGATGRRQVALAPADGEVDGETALAVERRDVEVGVEDLDVGGGLDVARRSPRPGRGRRDGA